MATKKQKKQKTKAKKRLSVERGSTEARRSNVAKGLIQPLGDRVLVKESAQEGHEKTASGIIIPRDSEKDSGTKKGVVIAVGPGRHENGVRVPMTLKPGDKVLFQWGEKVTIEGEEYYLVREGEILGVLN